VREYPFGDADGCFSESECREAFESEEMADLDKTNEVNQMLKQAHIRRVHGTLVQTGVNRVARGTGAIVSTSQPQTIFTRRERLPASLSTTRRWTVRRTPNICETQMNVAAHADTVSDDKETKVEEILTMILITNASTVRNLVKPERTRICPDTNGLYYNRASTSIVSAM